MANIHQTEFGWGMPGPDGSMLELPDDVARQLFPDHFANPDPTQAQPSPLAQMPEDQPVGAAPGLGVPQLTPPVVDVPQSSQPEQAAVPALQPGQSYSYSGHSGPAAPLPTGGLIDIGAMQRNDDIANKQVDQAYGEKVANLGQEAALRDEADRAMQPYDMLRERYMLAANKQEEERYAAAKATLAAEEQRVADTIAAIPTTDPKRFWHDLTGFQQAMGVMAMVTGGMLAGRTGSSTNMGVQTAMSLMEKDMQAQEANAATARAKVGYAQDRMERTGKQLYYDKIEAQEMRGFKLEALAASIEREASKYKSKLTQFEMVKSASEVRLEAAKFFANASQERSAMYADAVGKNEAIKVARYNAQTSRMAEQFSERQATDKAKADAQAAEKAGYIVGTSTGFNVEGREVRINTGDAVRDRARQEKLVSSGAAAGAAYRALERLGTMDINRLRALEPAQRSAYLQSAATVVLGYSGVSGQKLTKLSDKDMAMIKQAAGVGSIDQGFSLVGNEALQKRMLQARDDLRESMNRMANEDQPEGATKVNWDPFATEGLPDDDITSASQASGKLIQTKLDPAIRGGTAVPAGSGNYTPTLAQEGAYTVKPHNQTEPTREAPRGNPEYDLVKTVVGAAETYSKLAAAGQLSAIDTASAIAETKAQAAELKKAGYTGEARELEAISDSLGQHMKDLRKADPSIPGLPRQGGHVIKRLK